eukprot:2031534-Amphidinium_carterae.3
MSLQKPSRTWNCAGSQSEMIFMEPRWGHAKACAMGHATSRTSLAQRTKQSRSLQPRPPANDACTVGY